MTNVVARPGHERPVVASLIGDAIRRGAVALKGRAEPATMVALAGRNSLFLQRTALIAHAADRALLEPLRSGDAFVTGMAGETWIRLIGGLFT